MGPTDDTDVLREEELFLSYRVSNPRPPNPWRILYTDWATPAPLLILRVEW